MNKKFINYFSFLCILLALVIIGYAALTFYRIRTTNLSRVSTQFESLKDSIATSYLAKGSFNSDFFKTNIHRAFQSDPSLRALVVLRDNSDVEYLYARNSEYLLQRPETFSSTEESNLFKIEPVFEEKLSSSIILPSTEKLRLDCVYGVIEKADIFMILRNALIPISILAACLTLLIILYPRILRKPAEEETIAEEKGEIKTGESRRAEEPELSTPEEERVTSSTLSDSEIDSGGLFSSQSGLGWEEYLEKRLDFELRRAASFDQDLSLALLKVQPLKREESLYAEIAKLLIEQFPFQDMAFEYGSGGYAIILPNTELERGISEMEAFRKRIREHFSLKKLSIAIGLSSRSGRLLTGKRIITEAHRALLKSEEDPARSIIAFRSDPEKYRQYIASTIQK